MTSGTIAGLAQQLRAALGGEAVVTDRTRLLTYECDGLAQYKVTPALVVLPRTTAQVPDVVRGSGTGLSGGALPHADGVLVVLSQMRAVVDVDPATQRAVLEPGVV